MATPAVMTAKGTFATVGLLAAAPGKPTFASPLRDHGTAAWTGTFRPVGFPAASHGKPPFAWRLHGSRPTAWGRT